jgi:hypothetical protein
LRYDGSKRDDALIGLVLLEMLAAGGVVLCTWLVTRAIEAGRWISSGGKRRRTSPPTQLAALASSMAIRAVRRSKVTPPTSSLSLPLAKLASPTTSADAAAAATMNRSSVDAQVRRTRPLPARRTGLSPVTNTDAGLRLRATRLMRNRGRRPQDDDLDLFGRFLTEDLTTLRATITLQWISGTLQELKDCADAFDEWSHRFAEVIVSRATPYARSAMDEVLRLMTGDLSEDEMHDALARIIPSASDLNDDGETVAEVLYLRAQGLRITRARVRDLVSGIVVELCARLLPEAANFARARERVDAQQWALLERELLRIQRHPESLRSFDPAPFHPDALVLVNPARRPAPEPTAAPAQTDPHEVVETPKKDRFELLDLD